MKLKISPHQLTVYIIQTLHYQSLYLEVLPSSIISSNNLHKPSEADAEINDFFDDISLNWQLGELRIVGYVGLYHLWEKFSKEFISKSINKKCSEWPKSHGRKSFPQTVISHMDDLNIHISDETKFELIEANLVVNAYKHGEEALDKLLDCQPDYFYEITNNQSFYVPENKLQSKFHAILNFWDQVESQVDIDYSQRMNAHE